MNAAPWLALALALMPLAGAKEALFDSGDLTDGTAFRWRFDAAGTYLYHCHLHFDMTGRVIVIENGTEVAHVTIKSYQFSPENATVGVGGEVVWTNTDAVNHTVTSGPPGSHEEHAVPALGPIVVLLAVVTLAAIRGLRAGDGGTRPPRRGV